MLEPVWCWRAPAWLLDGGPLAGSGRMDQQAVGARGHPLRGHGWCTGADQGGRE